MKLEITPVNKTCLINCLSENEWERIRYPERFDNEEEVHGDYVKKGGFFLHKDSTEEHDPDDMVVYAHGVIEKLSEKPDIDIRIGDYITYNHGSVVHKDNISKEKKKIVRYSDIIVVFRPSEEK